ncbi:MAG TPA: SUMF1/EgtB/PvdO family nonheme iron enzyme [Anaerolineae bacterium]|nr:SUMF1/EgtB/PvdO family nonheme iron enzyme [Anaerolineae bacterium]
MTQTTKSLGKLGKFEILAELGRGSYGVVYRARDPVLEREVALKVIHPRLLVQAEFVQRFFLEARVAARLDHPNIVPIHDVVESGGSLFIVMKLLEGKSLQRFIESKAKLEPAQAVPLLAQVGSAVDYAHSKGVLHRDLKPANVMVREDGHATLTDFGLAKALSESYASSGEKQAGTMPYMAPEEFDAGFGEVGPATDLYALGIMAYEMLGGQVPFRGSSTQIMHGHCMAAVPAVGGLAPGVSEVLERALAKKPSERFGSAEEFVAALRGALATAVRQEVRQEPAAPLDVPKANGAPQVPQPTGVPKAGATKLLGTTGITLVWVPPGTYWMGAADSDRGASRDEKPRHQVELDGYWIGQTQVTNAQYQRFIDAGGYSTRSYWSDAGWTWKTSNGVTQPGCWGDSKWNGADQPVVEVSWYEAEAYAKWAGGRLPTEAEWEAAARGGPLSKGYTYAGSNDVGSVAWYEDNSGGVTHAVKGKAPNELGLYDMSGNVWEWVADWYVGWYYSSTPRKNPSGPTSGSERVLRGGSWISGPTDVCGTDRATIAPGHRSSIVGFRVAQ